MRDDLKALSARLGSLKRRFETVRASYREIADGLRMEDATIEWTRSPRYGVPPFDIERMIGQEPPAPLKSRPKRLDGRFAYIFGKDGRIMAEFQYPNVPGRYETYWQYSSDQVDTVLFDYFEPDKRVISVQQLILADGLPIAFLRYAERGILLETYEYRSGALARAFSAAREHNEAAYLRATDEFFYSGGRLSKVMRSWENVSAKPVQVFPRRHP